MSETSVSLIAFKKKIEEAVVLVPSMIAEEKLKAVQFWNVVSERLQEIVNNSAADINALAMRMEQQEELRHKQLADDRQNSETLEPSVTSTSLVESIANKHSNDTTHTTDRPQLFLPLLRAESRASDEITNEIVVNDSSIKNNNNQTNVNNGDIEQQLSTVITSYGSRNDQQSSHLLIALENTTKTRHSSSDNLSYNCSSKLKEKVNSNKSKNESHNNSTFTASVIQEVDQTRQRRNVIQSTHKAMQVLENNVMNPNFDNNLLDDVNQIKIIDDECEDNEGESSDTNFNDTSFNIIYDNCNEIESKICNEISETENELKTTKKINGKKSKLDKFIDDKNICDICHKLLPNNSALVTHKLVHTKPYECTECVARFSTKGNLLVHQRRHTGEKPFACGQCPASFSTKGNLKRHIKAHSGERPWKCSQCDSRFTEKKSLKVHMRRHTGEKPYKCSVCEKSFSQTGVLQTHMALHLDERKHLCELCGKAFRQRSQLRLHVLRHEGVKRWDCSDCDAKFLTKGDLERHHRVHTGERPFVCDLCGKTFTRQQSLNEHSNRHYGLKPYSCTVCNKTFAEMSACYKHIKVHNKQQSTQSQERFNGKKETSKKLSSVKSTKEMTKNKYDEDLVMSDSDNSRSLHAVRSVIQSATAGTLLDKNLIYVEQYPQQTSSTQSNMDVPIDETTISTISNNNIEYVDFAAINILANASTTAQQSF